LAAQRIRLGLTAALRHRLSKVRKQHREPQPQGDLQVEAECILVRGEIAEEIDCRDDAANLDDEHDGLPHHLARIELGERIDEGAANDLCIPE